MQQPGRYVKVLSELGDDPSVQRSSGGYVRTIRSRKGKRRFGFASGCIVDLNRPSVHRCKQVAE